MRYQAYLRERYRALLGYVGGIWVVVAITILSPLVVLPFFPEELPYAFAFVVTGIPLALVGIFIRMRTSLGDAPSPTVQEGMVAILIAWISAILVGAIPFMLLDHLNFTQAVFESTSGWTTTGLSVINVEEAPRIILFYRSVLQFVGGAGFAIIVLSSITGPTGSGLSAAEGRDDQLAPHVRQSAGIVIQMYVTYAILGIIALVLVGMDWFDAINHAFTALSTGGFSTRVESIGYYDSAAIEMVIIVLMLLGTLNFYTVYVLIKGKYKPFLRNGEIHLMAFMIPIGIMLLFISVGTQEYFGELWKPLRVAAFEFISAVSTTGFSTESYTGWSHFGLMIMIVAMLIGGGSGSTAGGIKQFRIYILLKALYWDVRRAFLPEHAVNEPIFWRGERQIVMRDSQIRRIALFTFLYLVLFLFIVTLITAHGYSISSAMFEAASSLSTVGLSIGVTAADAPPTLLWLESFGMLLGRLEFFAMMIGIIKLFRDGYTMFKPAQAEVN